MAPWAWGATTHLNLSICPVQHAGRMRSGQSVVATTRSAFPAFRGGGGGRRSETDRPCAAVRGDVGTVAGKGATLRRGRGAGPIPVERAGKGGAGTMIDIYGYSLDEARFRTWQRALVLAREREITTAIAELNRLLRDLPDFVPAKVQSAHWLLALDRYRDARRLVREAASAALASYGLALEVVRLLRRFEDGPFIEQLVDRMDWSGCTDARVLASAAAELAPIGLYAHASRLLDLAETLEPEMPVITQLRGTLELVAGNMPKARELLISAAQAPGAPAAYLCWLLSLQPAGDTEFRDELSRLQRELTGRPLRREDEIHLAFALHNQLHAAGRYDEAWRALEHGCGMKRSSIRYDEARQNALFERLLRMTPARGPSPVQRDGHVNVVFVVGMHRSGTSLLERMLSGHSAIADGGESYGFTAALRHAADHYCRGVLDIETIERIDRGNRGAIADEFHAHAGWRARGRKWVTEKLPSNFLNLGFILDAMPGAKVLHLKRDPLDTCFSNLRTYFSDAAGYSYDQAELARYFLRYQALMRHWHDSWPGRILDVEYEALVGSPEHQTRKILSYLGLHYETDVLAVDRPQGHVATASVGTVREGVQSNRGGAWRHYERQLQTLVAELHPAYAG